MEVGEVLTYPPVRKLGETAKLYVKLTGSYPSLSARKIGRNTLMEKAQLKLDRRTKTYYSILCINCVF
jgi:hypothetical protein